MKVKYFLTLFPVLFFALPCLGQYTVVRFPFQFDQFDKSTFLLNPALANPEVRLGLSAGYKSFSGLRKNVKSFYSGCFYSPQSSSDSSGGAKQVMGVMTYSEQESELILRNSIYLNYSIHLPIYSNLRMSAGVSGGLINHALGATSVISGVSDLAPDTKIGLAISDESFSLGLGINSLFNPRLRAIEEVSIMKRYYSLFLNKKVEISPEMLLSFSSLVRYMNKDKQDYAAMLKAVFHDRLEVGVNYRIAQSLVFIAGIRDLPLGKQGGINIFFSYNSPFRSNPLSNSHSYEIIVGYNYR